MGPPFAGLYIYYTVFAWSKIARWTTADTCLQFVYIFHGALGCLPCLSFFLFCLYFHFLYQKNIASFPLDKISIYGIILENGKNLLRLNILAELTEIAEHRGGLPRRTLIFEISVRRPSGQPVFEQVVLLLFC